MMNRGVLKMAQGGSFGLQGKVALITGAARGIGAAVALGLAREGANVLVTDVLDEAGIRTRDTIRAAGDMAEYLELDVTKESSWTEVVDQVVADFGGIDILVNNAGIEMSAPLLETSIDDFRRIAAVNVDGVFLGLKHGVRAMRYGAPKGRGGVIINMSSIAGLIGAPTYCAYGASKGAVRSMTKHAAMECARFKYGIRVNSVHPGVVATDMGEAVIAQSMQWGLFPDAEQARASIIDMHPLGRLGTPGDMTSAVLFLASDMAAWMTGAELVVDGGAVAY